MIKNEEWNFPAANGEGDIFVRTWLVDDPVGIVQIAHGMSEHSERYDGFARYLCSHGFSVVANDHAGHGLSPQGHIGAFSKKSGGFDDTVTDMHKLTLIAKEKIGDLPYILFGHSMGSSLSAVYAERFGGDLSALVLCGMPYAIKSSKMFQFLAGFISAFRGHDTMSPLLAHLKANATEIPEGVGEWDWLSRDSNKVNEFINDPLCGFDYTAGGYSTMLHAYHHIISKKWGRLIPDIPILVVAGAEDVASDYGNGPKAYAAQLEATGHTKVDLKLFPEFRHEITNELNRDEVFKYLCEWVLDKTGNT